jgi:hypothetical protein
VIICDFDLIEAISPPDETNTPLVVDSDTVLSGSISFEFLHAVSCGKQ